VSPSRNISGAYQVSLANEQSRHAVVEAQLVAAVNAVLADSTFTSATVSLAVVDDPTIHEINRRHLDHDYPTDVLSFVLHDDGEHLEGEVIISADTAAAAAAEIGWAPATEQLLYVIHGTLHLVGHDDRSPAEVDRMRAAEEKYLRQLGTQRAGADNSAQRGATSR
jgi:probable rRNA maturation factor